jgi:signal peptidase I
MWLGASALALAGALALLVATKVMGLVPIAVRSGSMSPKLPVNTLLLVEQVPADSVRVGDVISFDPPGEQPRTTHRVVERLMRNGHWYFRTKGDANPTADAWRRGLDHPAAYERGVSYGAKPALRVRWHLPGVGRLADLSEHTTTRRALMLVPLALLMINTMLLIWRPPLVAHDGHEGATEGGLDAVGAAEDWARKVA